MADDNIAVELVAKVDQLVAGLDQAKSVVQESVDSVKSNLQGLTDSAKEQTGLLSQILSGEQFLVFAEAARSAFEVVKIAFESIEGTYEGTIGKAEELGLASAKMSSLLGISGERAAGLSAALENVGSSTDAYTSMALHLQHTLETSSTVSAELKGKFLDANGAFLTGADLMDRLQEVTSGYNDTAERNAVLTELLGRRAKDYFDIGRVTSTMVQEQTDIFKSFNVSLNDGGESSKKLEDAAGNLKTTWSAFSAELGQQMMPIATRLFDLLKDVGTPALHGLADITRDLATLFNVLELVVAGLAEVVKLAFVVINDAIHLDFHKAETDFTETMHVMAKQATDTADAIKRLWSVAAEAPKEGGNISTWGRGLAGEDTGVPGWGKSQEAKKGPKDNSADEEISSEKAIALEKISIEEATNQHLLAMGAESVEQFVAQQREIENEKYAVKVEALEKELALPNRTKAQIQKTNDEIKLAFEQHVGELVKIAEDGESRKAAVAKEALANAQRADEERLAEGKSQLQALAAAGQLSVLARDEQEMQLTATIRKEQLARLDAEMATLDHTTKAYEDMVKQKEKLEKEFSRDMSALSAERRKDLSSEVSQGIAPLAAGFHTAIADMTTGTKSFGQTMEDVGKAIENSFISMCEKLIEEWAVKEITNALLTHTTQAASGIAQVESEAAIAAASAFAATAAIPIVGLGLAPAAAGAAYAQVMAFAPLASAAGGMTLDKDQLLFAHKEEMVLPANLSRGIQDMIGNGQSGGGGSAGHTFNFSPNVSGGQSKSLAQMLHDEGDAARSWFVRAARDGAFR